MHMREKGKRPLLWKCTPSGKESRASCQGTTFHFPDMKLRQERGGSCEVHASAGPPGTPLPGGRKSMWFLSYLWEGWSTASNTDIWWAAKRREKKQTMKMKMLWLLSHCYLIYSLICCCWTHVCVSTSRWIHMCTPHCIPLQPRLRWFRVAKSVQPVSEKVSNEENPGL